MKEKGCCPPEGGGRNYGIDMLRILAMLFVVTLHVLGRGKCRRPSRSAVELLHCVDARDCGVRRGRSLRAHLRLCRTALTLGNKAISSPVDARRVLGSDDGAHRR